MRQRSAPRAPFPARRLNAAAFLFLALSLPAIMLQAQDGEPSSEEPVAVSETFLDEVTVAATRSRRSTKETPGQIDVISALEIARLGYTSAADLVRLVPGVYVDGDVTRLGASGFNIRGIGGNRVLTQIDGIPTAEAFDFGPLSVTRYSLDLDALESVEIVRSAGSALYGSDALGGVVALTTRGPRGYLGDRSRYLGLKAGYDGRASELAESLVLALGNERWQGSLFYSRRDGEALDNQGRIISEDQTRTAPNPIDRRQDQVLLKLSHDLRQGSVIEATLEAFDGRADTEVFTARAPASAGVPEILDFDARDGQERRRASLEQSLVMRSVLADSVLWRLFAQNATTEQLTVERLASAAGPSLRDGLLSFEQTTAGLDLELRKGVGRSAKHVLTYGVSLHRDRFDQLRDREERLITTGEVVASSLIFPTKYFPESDVDEFGAFVQAELELLGSRLRLISGLRFDRYALDADQNDAVYASGNPGSLSPVDLKDQALSPKLGLVYAVNEETSLFAQFSRGFRAPPMSSVNNGFTNQAFGYKTLPNPDLLPETSDQWEAGLRGSHARGSYSLTVFDNHYEDFIEAVFLGFNPRELLVEFQPQNVDQVRIYGIELAAEAVLSRALRARGAFSYSEGENETLDEPLEEIAPPSLVVALRYQRPTARWGLETTVTVTAAKDADDLPSASTQFQAPGYQVVDVAWWLELSDRWMLQLSGWNLTDETWWSWPLVRGQADGSATIDRYTQPGRNVGLQARFTF